MTKKIFVYAIFMALFFGAAGAPAFALGAENAKNNLETQNKAEVHFFGRDDCKFCMLEKDFIEKIKTERSDIDFIYYNIAKDAKAKDLFDKLTEANDLPRVTPITLAGGQIIQGFNSEETTGALIIKAATKGVGDRYSIDYYLSPREVLDTGSTCDEDAEGAVSCEIAGTEDERFVFSLPVVGVVNLKDLSLFSLATVLGLVDGFNPCAMWVLVTFLLILVQIGDRKKMWQTAGLFIVAEALMYYLILNVWYKTWDFVGLDAIVTPLVGFVAIGGGVYFLSKYFKDRGRLTCDVTDFEYQQGIEAKIKKLIHSPLTLATIAGIIGIALSVNIIEFACSIGIPQAFTKILEINHLGFIQHQFYLWTYIFFYMVDDFVVFGLALYGFDKLHGSYKYAQYSALIGGILMLVLGAILVFAPNLLIL